MLAVVVAEHLAVLEVKADQAVAAAVAKQVDQEFMLVPQEQLTQAVAVAEETMVVLQHLVLLAVQVVLVLLLFVTLAHRKQQAVP
jgi:hypothetical protein